MSWKVKIRRWWHLYVRRYGNELCDDCGRPVARGIRTWWAAPGELWTRVMGGPPEASPTVCPACFTRRAGEHDLLVYFEAKVWQDGE